MSGCGEALSPLPDPSAPVEGEDWSWETCTRFTEELAGMQEKFEHSLARKGFAKSSLGQSLSRSLASGLGRKLAQSRGHLGHNTCPVHAQVRDCFSRIEVLQYFERKASAHFEVEKIILEGAIETAVISVKRTRHRPVVSPKLAASWAALGTHKN